MKILKPQQADYTIQQSNVIEQIQLTNLKATARLVYIYPGVPQSNGLLKTNVQPVTIGLLCDGQRVVTDVIGPNDPPYKYPLPDGPLPNNEQAATLISNFLVMGTAGDGIYLRFWDDTTQTIQ